MQSQDDMVLLREYATRHSETAFETLVSRYAPFVHSAALRQVRDPHLAQEVSQVVFTILAAKAGRISHRTLLSGWLFNTTRYVVLAQNRMATRRRQYEQEAGMQSHEPLDTPDLLWEQIAPLLDEALTQLGEKDRQAVLLRYFENKSLAQVGNEFGAGEDAVRMRINRALERLRKFFIKRGVVSTSATLGVILSVHSVQAAPIGLAKVITSTTLTKGITGGASLPALIQGASKLMAWTKIKTTLTIGIASLLAITAGIGLTEMIHTLRIAYSPEIQGTWEGRMLLDYDGIGAGDAARTHVVLRLTKTNGGYTATADLIEMGRSNIPMGKVVYDYPSLHIEQNARDIWNLKVNADGSQMVLDHYIHFIQSTPVLFLRTAKPDAVPAPLSEDEFTPHPDSVIQGYWKGEFVTETDAMTVTLMIAEQDAGNFHGNINWPEFGFDGAPLTGRRQDSQVRFTGDMADGRFQGAINADDTEIIGSWTQAGKSHPASFKRADYHAEHALDDLKDYSFHSDADLAGHWKGSWTVTIAKTKAVIPLMLDIARLPDGSYATTLSHPDHFGDNGPVVPSEVQYDLPHVHFEWKWLGSGYDGILKDGKLVGYWLRSGGRFPMVLERDKTE